MNAYQIAQDISEFQLNVQRMDYVRSLMAELSTITGRHVEEHQLPFHEKYGNVNFILPSGDPNPLLITAHYDAYVMHGDTTTPGANDNGSGVGAVFQAACELSALPVDFVIFGGEEIGCRGAIEYLALNKSIRGVVNLDTCGSGGNLGILIPKVVQVGDGQLMETDGILNQAFINSASSNDFLMCLDDPLAIGDHCPFLISGVPATTIQGEDWDYFGIVDGVYDKRKMVMHSPNDTIDWVDEPFLNNVVKVVVEGTRSLMIESKGPL
jgi:hypothetical protein